MKHFKQLAAPIRYTMIGDVFSQTNMSTQQLSHVFGVSMSTVRTAIEYCKNPWPTFQPGRPKILQKAHLQFIEVQTMSDRSITCSKLVDLLKENFPELALTKLNQSTVNRARHKMGLHYLPTRQNCAVTQSARNTRVAWCKKQLEIGRNWHNVVFSDESWFEIGPHKKWIWRRHDDYSPDTMTPKVAHPPKVMIWGAIGHNFKSKLVFIQGNVTGDVYFDEIICGSGLLEDADQRWGLGNWILQQDNARPHVRKDILEAMMYYSIDILPQWPPYSPDLNPIELVWAIMKRRVEAQNPKSIQELKNIIFDVWENLSMQTINSLVDQMPNRIQKVISSQGYTIQI